MLFEEKIGYCKAPVKTIFLPKWIFNWAVGAQNVAGNKIGVGLLESILLEVKKTTVTGRGGL
jgi:hypothetical protein